MVHDMPDEKFLPKMTWSEVYGDVPGPDVFLFCFDGYMEANAETFGE